MTTLREAAQQALEALELAQTDVHWELNSPTRKFLRKAEKALLAALAEPVQEPVAWLSTDCIGERDLWFSPPLDGDQVLPLYAAPPQRKPLTKVDLRALYDQHAAYQEEGPEASGWWEFARAVERAHGIK